MKRKLIKSLKWFGASLVLLIITGVIAFQVSPVPSAMIIRQLFNGPVEISDPITYEKAAAKIQVDKDNHYPSAHKKNNYDIYYPKHSQQALPVLIWVHGGGFVGGDKEGAMEFATRIVADLNMAVVAMNYEPAPDSHYPNQLMQVDELVHHLTKTQDPKLDLSKLIFGGDSAGAQIAIQYVIVQTNTAYAKDMDMTASLNPAVIKGVISYSGPVDLQQTVNQEISSPLMKFFVQTVGWSLLGEKQWQADARLAQASLVAHVTDDFPPTYITDGNTLSFQDQGIALEKSLDSLDVAVEGLFFKDEPKELPHEYQFNYELEEANVSYRQTVNFLSELIK